MSFSPSTTSDISEEDYLRREAAAAKRNATLAMQNATAVLGQKIDPRNVTRKHPVLSLVGALLGGFIAASAAIPSKAEQELHRLERLQRASAPPPPAPNGHPHEPAAKATFWAVVVKELIGLIKPILTATITASIKGPPPPDQPAKSDR